MVHMLPKPMQIYRGDKTRVDSNLECNYTSQGYQFFK